MGHLEIVKEVSNLHLHQTGLPQEGNEMQEPVPAMNAGKGSSNSGKGSLRCISYSEKPGLL